MESSSSNIDPRASHSKREALVYLGVVGVAIAAVALPAVVVAVVAAQTVGRWVRRSECFIIGGAATAIFLLDPGTHLVAWFKWCGAIIKIGGSPWAVPVPQLLLFSAALFGLGLGTLRTGIVSKRAGSAKLKRLIGFVPKEQALIPTHDELQKIRKKPPAGGVLAIDAGNRTITGADDGGHDRQFAFGVDSGNQPVTLTETEIGMHGLFLGSTGAGKTEALKSFIAALMDLGWSGMVVDCKEDTSTDGFRDFLDQYTNHHAVQYQELAVSTAGRYWFNPLAGMGPDEARDTILSLTDFDDEYWQNINKKVLGQLVTLCYAAAEVDEQTPHPTMYDIGKILGSGNLAGGTKRMRAKIKERSTEYTVDDFSALSGPSTDEQKSAIGFGSKLTQIYETQVGRQSLRAGNGKQLLDVTSDGLTYIGLDTQGKPDLSRMISSAVLQRMSVYAAQRTTGAATSTNPRFLIIDEANWVHRDIIKNLLSRARAAGISVALATQSPLDWVDRKGDDWQTMSQNCNFAVIMAQGSPDSAERCAEFIGSEPKLSFMSQIRDGKVGVDGMMRENVDYKVRPDELRALTIGEAILRVNKPRERVTWMTVAMRDPKAMLTP